MLSTNWLMQLHMNQLLLVPLLLPASALAQSSLDRLEREQLAPPVSMPAAPLPFVTQGRGWDKPPLERAVGKQLTSPPLALMPSSARLADQERGSSIARLPAYDQPPLGLVRDLPAVARVWLTSLALAYASAPKADEPQQPEPRRLLVDRPPTAQHDPAAALARIVSQPIVGITRTPAPFLVHSIPDPFQRSEEVRLRTPPADTDAPGILAVQPARPNLPTEAGGQ